MIEEKTCKNCGKEISKYFKLCPYCGEKVEEEILEIYCPSCGKSIRSDFKVCPYCGNNPNNQRENYNNYNNYNTENRTNYYSNNYEISPKSGIACLLLWLFLGGFGVHRLYVGKIGSGIIMIILYIAIFIFLGIATVESSVGIMVIITAIIWFVWWITDLVLILTGKFRDSQGRCIKLNN